MKLAFTGDVPPTCKVFFEGQTLAQVVPVCTICGATVAEATQEYANGKVPQPLSLRSCCNRCPASYHAACHAAPICGCCLKLGNQVLRNPIAEPWQGAGFLWANEGDYVIFFSIASRTGCKSTFRTGQPRQEGRERGNVIATSVVVPKQQKRCVPRNGLHRHQRSVRPSRKE